MTKRLVAQQRPLAAASVACLALLTAMALAGCTPKILGNDYKQIEYHPAPAVVQDGVSCPSSLDDFPSNADSNYPSAPRGNVPEGFVTEKAFICRAGTVEKAGIRKVGINQEELQGDFTPLLTTLAVPSDRAEGEYGCTADLEYIQILWLVNADGGAIDVAWPTTICHKASGKPETQKAIDALTVVDSTVVP